MTGDPGPPLRSGHLEDLPGDEPYAGVQRRTFSTAAATLTSYRFSAGARFPLHRHEQEQITMVQDGDVEFTVAGEVQTLTAGAFSVVAPGVEHGLLAGPHGASILAIVAPRRSDPDAYDLA
jgi:quercetin dioxygenase-like cupin family protein